MTKKRIILILIVFLFLNYSASSFVISSESDKLTVKYDKDISKKEDTLNLKPGDIAFRQPDLVPDNMPFLIDHCLLFVEYNNTNNKYVFIEASAWGVRYKEADREELFGNLWKGFRRVKSKYVNDIQKQNAIAFAKLQVGKEFQGDWATLNKNYNPNDIENDIYANEWYCSELIWAAYYNCNNSFPEKEPEKGYLYAEGIDLDPNGWEIDYIRPLNNHSSSIIYPRELYNIFNNKYIENINLNEVNKPAKIKNYTNNNLLSLFKSFLKQYLYEFFY